MFLPLFKQQKCCHLFKFSSSTSLLQTANLQSLLSTINGISLGTRPSANTMTRICAPTSTDSCVNITKSAIRKLEELKTRTESGLSIRVDVGGCHGFQYIFNPIKIEPPYANDQSSGTYSFSVGGGYITIDKVSFDLIKNSTIDYTHELIGSKFVIVDNPKVDDACGCGVSFGLKSPNDK